MLDPTNSILHLKLPIFILFLLFLGLNYKPQIKYLNYFLLIAIVIVLSFFCGKAANVEFDYSYTVQFVIFFLLFISLFWDSEIDLFRPIVLSSLVVSIITIIGFVVMTAFPDIEGAFFVFSCAHDYTFIMSRRSFLGIEIISFFYKSIPLVIIPASYYLNEIVVNGRRSFRNIVLVIIFLLALFFAGNRAMMGVVFLILFFISYKRISKLPMFKPLLIVALISMCIIGIMSVTEEGEESNDIKFGHLLSYSEYFIDNWYMILFGSGAGSLFYSKGFMDMTGITEWTYLEIIRLYGLLGLVVLLLFFLYPLKEYRVKMSRIYGWKAFSLGYIFYLLVSASNPYLLGSTGFLCILFMFSVVSNPKYLTRVDI